MRKTLLLTGMIVVAVTAPGVAQDKAGGDGPGHGRGILAMGAGRMDGEFPVTPALIMSKELGLSKEQQQQVRNILESRKSEITKLHASVGAIARRQVELMGQDSPDEAAILKGVDDVAGIRAELAKSRVKQVLEMLKVLTPEQRAKVRELMKGRMEKRDQGDRRKLREDRQERGKPGVAPGAPGDAAPRAPGAPAAPRAE